MVTVKENHLVKIQNEMNIRYIPTIEISANADKKVNVGTSMEYNLLDVATQLELEKLIKQRNKNVEIREEFLEKVNEFLEESGKKIFFQSGKVRFETRRGKYLELSQLSSGERQLLCILATAANTHGKPSLFLMDEPEVSLHLSWQEKIIDAIMVLNPLMQIVAVTHSPGIVMNGYMDSYVEMQDVIKRNDNV